MEWFKRNKRAAEEAVALLDKTDALIARADALIQQLESLAESLRAPGEKELTDGLYGILSFTGRGEVGE